jgi:hypothetical protein
MRTFLANFCFSSFSNLCIEQKLNFYEFLLFKRNILKKYSLLKGENFLGAGHGENGWCAQ